MIQVFDSDDAGYLEWIVTHPNGYVLNRRRGESAIYLVLHRTTCRAISAYSGTARADAFTGRGYLKVCAADVVSLTEYARNEGGRLDGSFSSECAICDPQGTGRVAPDFQDEEGEYIDVFRGDPDSRVGLLSAVRALLKQNTSGLTPQEIRRLIKARYPSLFATESHLRNVRKGHYADLDHALLAQIYSSCLGARDICIDRTTKPIRYRLESDGNDYHASAPVEGASGGSKANSDLKSDAGAGSMVRHNRGLSANQASVDKSPGAGDVVLSSVSDFDLEHARNDVVRLCARLWRSTQEGDPPRSMSAAIVHLRSCGIIPYVTASLMLTLCAIRNASVYSDWRPNAHELEAGRHALAAIETWWASNPLR